VEAKLGRRMSLQGRNPPFVDNRFPTQCRLLICSKAAAQPALDAVRSMAREFFSVRIDHHKSSLFDGNLRF